MECNIYPKYGSPQVVECLVDIQEGREETYASTNLQQGRSQKHAKGGSQNNNVQNPIPVHSSGTNSIQV